MTRYVITRYAVVSLVAGLLAILLCGRALAVDGSVLGLSPDIDTLELYASPTAETAALTATAGELGLPAPILAMSNNGMYKIRFRDAEYWIISDDVNSSVERKVDTECDPKVAGNIVAHGVRGAGEECQ